MRVENGIAYAEDRMTLAEATRLLQEGEEALQSGVAVIDLGSVNTVDSSAISLILSWQRKATAMGLPLGLRNLPESLLSLARLYGVGELIPA